MKNKHTPGPWLFDGHGINHNGKRIANLSQAPYNYIQGKPVRNKQRDADGYLMAGSPNLLKACEWAIILIEQYEGKDECWDALNEAIKKATGE
jgi:hypothetical protein